MPGIPCIFINFLNQKIPSVKSSFFSKIAFQLISKDVADFPFTLVNSLLFRLFHRRQRRKQLCL